ncbi:MAG: hydrogenase maturation nickel metallochaperone HypA [Gammaproteobacteria bacterium]|nr:hydrogenase maturation nickel metallochaperone HypA [Gammaproteobacteria bacterium]MBT8106200.1 hydrogenase maturation nickel metallochaperone HypA [Gammaproteobacteria bacterium]NNF50462.1 hydrogenase maturation nickel metallochaperone HypA [Woeseiaceae bacterium]NNK26214.1 hydrogenase maturation nickel metallochaperone HypA [Woeseiaceae bacterium]NNL64250.1 hydrogenase maturation nickel metallochaperone HypA [Woeseiaceae bacterium]
MHELSVCLSLLEQVSSIAAEHRARRVTRIELEVGPLSGVEADLLRTAWPLACAGTIAVDAEFVIGESAIVVHCETCDAETPATANRLVCGECGDFRTRLTSGDEMILQRVELDTG